MTAHPVVLRLLGELEQLSTAYAEGDLSRDDFKARLRTMLTFSSGEG